MLPSMPPFCDRSRVLACTAALAALALPGMAMAQHHGGGWGNSPWQDDREPWRNDRVATQGNAEPSRAIDVETFRAADAGDLLGKGRIVVTDTSPPPPSPVPVASDGALAPRDPDETASPAKLPVYEAAVIDQLAGKGYDVAHASDPAQLIEIAVSRDVVAPEEAPHKPVSGEMSVGVSNRGVGYGMAIAVDLSKPKKAIIATRLDVRIRDKASNRVLWEGHAQGQTRLTDSGSDDTRVAGRLAGALFAKFPDGTVVPAIAGTARMNPAE
ncbi:DUF4136 domain-containing protein [Novosphingobium sp.]|uniref:DUF4136 domain-containing protein n=1 Tax=Novosphingobium sp. TaxID=1874826 RepID=UPI00333EDBDE